MSPRNRIPLPFGVGLDRDTGPMAGDPRAQEDVRNVYLTEGMAFLRKGSDPRSEFLTTERVLAGQALKVEDAGVAVTLDADGNVEVWRTTNTGESPTLIGTWFTLDPDADTPPVIHLAEVAGLMFMAHDEPAVDRRAPTAYYDPTAGGLFAVVASWAHVTTIDGGPANSDIRYWPVAAIGTAITVRYVDPGAPSQALSVGVVGAAITVNLATDAGSVLTSTAAQVLAAIQASSPASALVGTALPSGDTGAGVVIAVAATPIPDTSGLRFRGVVEHLGDYLSGWGYGTEAEPHPEYVRMSLPGDPATFELQYYEPIGQQGEPVRACKSTGRTLIAYKPFETWEHYGSDRSNFGVRPLSPTVGIAGARLAIVVDGTSFAWSHLGPRATDGGALVDLSVPLAIAVPAPDDLPDAGEAADGFAVYLPSRQEIRFHFGERFYAYALRTRQWAYGEMAYEPTCGFLLTGGGGDVVQPAYQDTLSITADIETP